MMVDEDIKMELVNIATAVKGNHEGFKHVKTQTIHMRRRSIARRVLVGRLVVIYNQAGKNTVQNIHQ